MGCQRCTHTSINHTDPTANCGIVTLFDMAFWCVLAIFGAGWLLWWVLQPVIGGKDKRCVE